MIDYRLLEIIVCPICNNKLFLNKKLQGLICKHDTLIFPIRNGIPVLLESESTPIILNDIIL